MGATLISIGKIIMFILIAVSYALLVSSIYDAIKTGISTIDNSVDNIHNDQKALDKAYWMTLVAVSGAFLAWIVYAFMSYGGADRKSELYYTAIITWAMGSYVLGGTYTLPHFLNLTTLHKIFGIVLFMMFASMVYDAQDICAYLFGICQPSCNVGNGVSCNAANSVTSPDGNLTQ